MRPVPRLTRKDLVLVAGLVAIALCCLFHFNGLITGEELRGRPRRVLPPALSARLRPLQSSAPDPRWAQCALAAGDVSLDRITLDLRCPDGKSLRATLTDAKTAGVPESCLRGTPLSTAFGCALSGDVAEAKRAELATAVAKNLNATFDGDPYVTIIEGAAPDNRSLRPHWSISAPLHWNGDDAVTAISLFVVFGFLWLVATGWFGLAFIGVAAGERDNRDFVPIIPLILAVIVRQGLTLHSVEEIELQFYLGWLPSRHSVLYPMFQLFTTQFAADPQRLTLIENGLIGSLATIPLYVFIKQRTDSRAAALLAAGFYALQPIIARFAPTDGPYALLLFFWFTGLAFLSQKQPNGRALFAGGALLGMAAACRMEGVLFLITSLLLLDLRALWSAIRSAPQAAALGLSAMVVLVASHLYVLLPYHLGGGGSAGDILQGRNLPLPVPDPYAIFRDILVNADRMGPFGEDPRHTALTFFRVLLVAGAAAGLFIRRLRVAPLALIGAFIVLAPFPGSAGCVVSMHRAVPTLALQCITAGLGVASLLFVAERFVKSQRVLLAGAAAALVIPAALLLPSRADLARRYVFNEEYDMVRASLAPGGEPKPNCTILAFPAGRKGDIDIHEYGQVVPEMDAIDCWEHDCLSRLSLGGCFYYVRSAACYFHQTPPQGCAGPGANLDDAASVACLDGPCARFERAAKLRPMAERSIDFPGTFIEHQPNYPARATIGVYEATGLQPAK